MKRPNPTNSILKASLVACGLSLALPHATLCGEEPTLRAKLLERAGQSKMPAEAKARMAAHLKHLSDSDITATALKKGTKAPDFQLKDHTGTKRSLSGFVAKGPVILTWYRGGW